MSASPPVRLERAERVATLWVDRPPVNVLDLETLAALETAVATLASLDDLALVVVRGAGPKAFSAGVSVADHTPDKVAGMLASFHRGLLGLAELPALTVAAVHGHCLGGGMELALACDFVLATEGARFGQPEIELGCFPPFAAALYPQRIGRARTLEMLVTGRLFPAAEAAALGLVDWVVPEAELETRLAETVARLTAKSTPVARLAKRAVLAGERLPLAPAVAEAERLYVEELTQVADMEEGLQSFLEKRRPSWRHR
jgi:cyclohexa-1,5-dienecarbonyl-CoA hydratase